MWEARGGRRIRHQERVCLYELDLEIFITRDISVMFTQRAEGNCLLLTITKMPFLSAFISPILPKERPPVIDVGNLAFPGCSMTL